MLHIALEIPLTLLLIRRRAQGDDPASAGVHRFGEAFDRTSLSSGIPSLEQDDHPEARGFHPVLHLHQLGLQPCQLLLVSLLFEALAIGGGVFLPFDQHFLSVIDPTVTVGHSVKHRWRVALLLFAHRLRNSMLIQPLAD